MAATPGGRHGSRSSIACKRCHQSKIKCDVSAHGSPCSRCRERGITDCEPIQSRRGTYDRKEWLKRVKAKKAAEAAANVNAVSASSDVGGSSRSSSSGSSCSSTTDNDNFAKQQQNQAHDSTDEEKGSAEELPSSSAASLSFLRQQHCFDLPPPDVLDALLSAYFTHVHPTLPILNRRLIAAQHARSTIPFLLLHSICFAAATHVPLAFLVVPPLSSLTVASTPVASRKEARLEYYRRAKLLFDSAIEKNGLVVVQSCILLSIYGDKREESWNTTSWIDAAATVLEHSEHASLPGLWRRIAWTLVSRDVFCATLLGKQPRINRIDNLPPLTINDFDDDLDCDDISLFGQFHPDIAQYVIEVSTLTLHLRDIVIASRHPLGISQPFILSILQSLDKWRARVPVSLRLLTNSPSSDLYIYAAALSLMYNHHLIYLHQMTLTTSPSPSSTFGLSGGIAGAGSVSVAIAQDSVSQIADLGSSLVTSSTIPLLPPDSHNSFFMSIVMLFSQIQNNWSTSSTPADKLLKTQLKVCEMVVYKAKETWDHAEWILNLSESLRQKLDALAEKKESLGLIERRNSFNQQMKQREELLEEQQQQLQNTPTLRREERVFTTTAMTTSANLSQLQFSSKESLDESNGEQEPNGFASSSSDEEEFIWNFDDHSYASSNATSEVESESLFGLDVLKPSEELSPLTPGRKDNVDVDVMGVEQNVFEEMAEWFVNLDGYA
ncbi:hypothetical protein BZA70DRAFT_312839 [Myxozyma melibiosi]|uniref:Zn(2)-C6 fungal-type domain-containing protein n=1 Tax=Myxozyma melibiosi TaxID=54550 RepID=A0ABR1EZN5_9ASCO